MAPGAGLSQQDLDVFCAEEPQIEQTGLSQEEIDKICEGAPAESASPRRRGAAASGVGGGLSQSELDRLCCECEGEDGDDEPDSSALYNAKRKRRITFSGMTAAIASMPIPEHEEDLRGGFTQEVLDKMAVVAEPARRDDSPVGTALRRRKLSRLAAGGAGIDNMLKVAEETVELAGQGSDAMRWVPASVPTPAGCESPVRSPRKRRPKNKESVNENMMAMSPSKNNAISPSKSIGMSPSKQAVSLENSPVKMSGKDDPISPPRKPRMVGAANPLSPLNPLSPQLMSPLS